MPLKESDQASHGTSSSPYSPKCLEGVFSEVHRYRVLERVMNFGQALLAPVAEGEVAVWKRLEHQ